MRYRQCKEILCRESPKRVQIGEPSDRPSTTITYRRPRCGARTRCAVTIYYRPTGSRRNSPWCVVGRPEPGTLTTMPGGGLLLVLAERRGRTRHVRQTRQARQPPTASSAERYYPMRRRVSGEIRFQEPRPTLPAARFRRDARRRSSPETSLIGGVEPGLHELDEVGGLELSLHQPI
jgi:hypothetical protein